MICDDLADYGAAGTTGGLKIIKIAEALEAILISHYRPRFVGFENLSPLLSTIKGG